MRRAIVPALLAIVIVAGSSVNASAFGLFNGFGHHGCDSGCEAACPPACVAEPTCGCEYIEPACGCEAVEPCCGQKKHGLLHRLFHHNNDCCDSGCAVVEPTCGCEVVEPTCGCEVVAPTCGCEVAAPSCGCEPSCCDHIRGLKHKVDGFFGKLFHKRDNCCDSNLYEPTCGCEPSCGFEAAPACGCGL